MVHAIALVLLVCASAKAGDNLNLNPFDQSVVPHFGIHLWNVASFNNQVGGETVDNRYGAYFRRVRFGFKGQPFDRFQYNLTLDADYLGKDALISSKGTPTTGALKIRYLYVTYDLTPNNEWFNLSGGMLPSHVSRESMISAWTISALDQSVTSDYIREFAIGKSNGVAPGLNLGGVGVLNTISGGYNVGIHEYMGKGTTQGAKYAPLFLGHAYVTFGDPEREKYKYSTVDNELENKKYISFGLSGSYQGKSDFFDKNTSLSTDIKTCLGGLHFMAEYNHMYRADSASFNAKGLLLRGGYNINWKYNGILEPTLCYRSFTGDDIADEMGFYDGEDHQLDIGINWWVSGKKLKVNLHYLINFGSGDKNKNIDAADGDERGSLLAIGLQLSL
jgi:hypothetical protein